MDGLKKILRSFYFKSVSLSLFIRLLDRTLNTLLSLSFEFIWSFSLFSRSYDWLLLGFSLKGNSCLHSAIFTSWGAFGLAVGETLNHILIVFFKSSVKWDGMSGYSPLITLFIQTLHVFCFERWTKSSHFV